jgi:hypothetical protein
LFRFYLWNNSCHNPSQILAKLHTKGGALPVCRTEVTPVPADHRVIAREIFIFATAWPAQVPVPPPAAQFQGL